MAKKPKKHKDAVGQSRKSIQMALKLKFLNDLKKKKISQAEQPDQKAKVLSSDFRFNLITALSSLILMSEFPPHHMKQEYSYFQERLESLNKEPGK